MLTILVACFTACRQDVAYTKFKHIDADEWFRSDTIVFHLSPMPDAANLKPQLVLRTSPDYQFQNLSLVVDAAYYSANGQHQLLRSASDTLECHLADDEGQLSGQGVFHREFVIPLPHLQLNTTDSLVVTVSHNMQRMQISNVESIGLQMIKVKF